MSQKVKRVTRRVGYTGVYATGVLTVTSTAAHYLVTGDIVTLTCPNVPQEVTGAVTVVDGTHFTIADTRAINFTKGEIVIGFFRTGQTGRQVFTLPRGLGISAVLQSFVTGTGGATYNLEASLDGTHWVSLIAVTHPAVDGDSDFTIIEPAWAYIGVDITAIGAATKLEILHSA